MSNQPLDNMSIRKAQLQKLDDFVKSLYDECQVFSKYMNMEDLEILYTHIHELIKEMLQCKNTDEFMAMIRQLHQSIAGVLIIVAPAQAAQVKAEMGEAYQDFDGKNFDDFLNNLHNTSVSKFGNKEKGDAQQEDEVQNDKDELMDMLDLKEQAQKSKKAKKQEEKLSDDDEFEIEDEPQEEEAPKKKNPWKESDPKEDDGTDPMEDIYKNF